MACWICSGLVGETPAAEPSLTLKADKTLSAHRPCHYPSDWRPLSVRRKSEIMRTRDFVLEMDKAHGGGDHAPMKVTPCHGYDH